MDLRIAAEQRARRLRRPGPNPAVASRFIAGVVSLGIVLASASARALTIDVTYDASVPTAMQTAFQKVVSAFDAAITTNVTTYIHVSDGTVNTTPIPSGDVALTEDTTYAMSGGYSGLKTALQSQYSATGFSAYLPASNPLPVSNFIVPAAEARAFAATGSAFGSTMFYTGASGSNPGYDAYIGFSSTQTFSFSGKAPAGSYDFTSVAEHEIAHVLGRVSTLDGSGVTSSFQAEPLDLFRYSAAGIASFSLAPSTPAYFSVNNGSTSLGTFADAAHNGGDPSEWQSPINNTSLDAENGLLSTGTNYGLSLSDETALEALGWGISGNNGNGLFIAADAPLGASVPEPASLAVMGIGLPALIRLRRRKT
jgi:hypothetical protein